MSSSDDDSDDAFIVRGGAGNARTVGLPGGARCSVCMALGVGTAVVILIYLGGSASVGAYSASDPNAEPQASLRTPVRENSVLAQRSHPSTTTTTTVGHCNPLARLSPPVRPHYIEIQDPWWREHCLTVNKGNYWEPPAALGLQPARNWCWAAVKMFAQQSAWHKKDITPTNYWNAQMLAAKKGYAPKPTQEIISGLKFPEICDKPEHGNYFGPEISPEERREASEWLKQTVAVFVVNIDRAWQRMNAIRARLEALGIEFTRIAGVDLSASLGELDGLLNPLEKAQMTGEIPRDWSYGDAKKNLWELYGESNKPGIYSEIAGVGTVGCAAAHLNAMGYASMLSRKAKKPLALILEDDVWLSDDFAVNLRRMLLAEAPCDWEAISLKSYNPVGECVSPHLARVWPDGNEPAEACRRAANWGFQSMLYRVNSLSRVRTRLMDTVWNSSRATCLVQDIALASISDEILFYAVPACQHSAGFLCFMKEEKGAGIREAMNR
mmetsp:Transcript_40496/g.111500  ORF Transcript_40496/g.111500 Transcript_40496/m.111500 type:complete len:496 (+) Transcript_40496:53-1540(+)